MKKHFYSHLVETTDITLELGNLELTNEERVHLISLVDANIHSSLMAMILDSLAEEDKKIFLKNIVQNNHDKTLKHLNANIKNLDKQMKALIKKTIDELREDIRSASLVHR